MQHEGVGEFENAHHQQRVVARLEAITARCVVTVAIRDRSFDEAHGFSSANVPIGTPRNAASAWTAHSRATPSDDAPIARRTAMIAFNRSVGVFIAENLPS